MCLIKNERPIFGEEKIFCTFYVISLFGTILYVSKIITAPSAQLENQAFVSFQASSMRISFSDQIHMELTCFV